MNIISSIKYIPKAGGIGYFADENKVRKSVFSDGQYEDFRIGGGTTLNHLSWAQILNVPTALLAIQVRGSSFRLAQGTDEYGVLLRQRMEEIGVSTDYIVIDDKYHTSVSHVFIDSYRFEARRTHPSTGDQHTYMFRGATNFITPEIVQKHFVPHLRHAKIVTSEISQVPLNSVKSLFQAAGERHVLRFLDMDLPYSVAVGAAQLGSAEDVLVCLTHLIDSWKPAWPAAKSSKSSSSPQNPITSSQGDVPDLFPELDAQMLLQEPPRITAERIADRCPTAQFIAVTSGRKGAGLCIHGHDGIGIQIIPDIDSADDTGAGDAFLGGLIAGLYHWGMPQSEEDIKKLGHLGSLSGAACCQQFGTLPDAESVMKMTSVDDMNIVKDLFLVPNTETVQPETAKRTLPTNAVEFSLHEDRENLKALLEVGVRLEFDRRPSTNRSSSASPR